MSRSIAIFFLLSLPLGVSADSQQWVTGYYIDSTISVSDIPWSKLTHAIDAFMWPADLTGNLTGIPDSNADAFTSAAHSAGVRALIGIRDNSSNLGLFSGVISNNLDAFVSTIVNFVSTHNYDGVDLDWEAGNFRGVADQNNYTNLISALRSALGTDKLITMSAYWLPGFGKIVQNSVSNLDQLNVMCYDMDQWNSDLYFNSATYGALGDLTHTNCASQTGNFAAYVPAQKIGVGIPFYGRVWSGCVDVLCSDGLHDPLQTWFGIPTQKSLRYSALLSSAYWSYPHNWDATHCSSYISVDLPGAADDRFISYTDTQQIGTLVDMGKNRGYGGVMIYELEYDFMPSETDDARHPLVAAVYSAVFGPRPDLRALRRRGRQ